MKKDVSEVSGDFRFLGLGLILVLLFGLAVVHSLFQEPKDSKNGIAAEIQSKDKSDRSPASVQPVEIAPAEAKFARPETLLVDCKALKEHAEVRGTHVRISAKDCAKQQVQITNRSNGFTASIVPSSASTFSTDFIDLKEGENVIEVSFQGQEPQKILVNRRVPASTN